MSLFGNLYHNKTPFSIKNLETVIESTYSKTRDVSEFKQKVKFSPSQLAYGHGKCPRYWYIAFTGATFEQTYDPQSIDNMEAGTDGHARIQRNVKAALDCDIELPIDSENPPVHGFCDLMVRFDGYELPVEIKTTRTEVFNFRRMKNQPADYHVVQLLVYLKILEKEYGLLMYEDKNDHTKLLLPVRRSAKNEQFLNYLWQWMTEVYAAYEAKTLPVKKPRSNAKICKSCPVSATCDQMDKEGVDLELLKFDKETLDM